MSQYLQFRSWMQSGSAAEKKLAAAATVIVVGLLSWAVVPTGNPAETSVATGAGNSYSSSGGSSGSGTGTVTGTGTATGGSTISGGGGTTGSGGSTGTGGTSSVSGGTNGGGGGTGGGGTSPAGSGGTGGTGGNNSPSSSGGGGGSNATSSCGRLTSSDVGVTPTTIKVADILLNLAGAIGNSAVGQASPQVQQQMVQAVVDYINANGGVACRKLTVDYIQANPIDSTSAQNICLQLQQSSDFAVMGGFAFPQGANDCLAQAKIPVLASSGPTPNEAKQYYPYLMSYAPDPIEDFKNAIYGMRDRGAFKVPNVKVAVLEDDCSQEINAAVHQFLQDSGLSSVTNNEFSCPSNGFASPNDMTNFATSDNVNKVTDVVVVTGGGSFKEFTTAAKGQNYKPTYIVSNYQGFMVTAPGSTGPDPANFDGTVTTTTTRFGEENTPSVPENAATQKCIQIFAKENLPASDVMGPYIGGIDCNLYFMLQGAAAHDPGPTRVGLANGLGQVGSLPMAFPESDSIYGPGTYTPIKITGGDFWWTDQFSSACTCWKVLDPTEHKGY